MIINQWRAHNVDGQAYMLTQAIDGKGLGLICSNSWCHQNDRTTSELQDMLEQGISAARIVICNWERGDLAGAVNHLEQWAAEAEDYTGEHVDADKDEAVDVSLPAFSDWTDLSAFAQDIGALLECPPETIIRSMSC